MGTDISGFVEYRAPQGGQEPPWHTAHDLDSFYEGRNYDAFGCLFGVRNYANFRPMAAGRGLPADASATVGARFAQLAEWCGESGLHGTTWITWAEVKTVDWDEPAEKPDSRLHQYRQTSKGLRMTGKSSWSPAFAEAVGLERGEEREWPEGSEWLIGDTLYRSVTLRRRDAVTEPGEWQPVWAAMKTLGARHGDDNVRLVVWFDD
ncbi:hypothetical protein [Streptomyces pratensis]|uniref:hypothetical protein n=1 Tax=Streptomyces pratensis TaxID=1169025 RepID=UPI0019337A65|nr:hypothetical protein [Streptomyces pratensis]